MGMNDPALEAAIDAFPVVAWLSKHTRVANSDGEDVYADCPICGGKKKLGVARVEHYNRGRLVPKGTANCFKCNEGGFGGEVWNGRASLIRFIKILEGCSWREAFALVYELAGIPEPPLAPKRDHAPRLPDGLVKLVDCGDNEPCVLTLRNRRVGHLVSSSYVCLNSGPYYERLILPAYFKEEFLGFEAKALAGQMPPSLYPAWLQTDTSLYTTRAWDSGSVRVVLTESIIDAETFSGFANAVGCFGGWKEGQLSRLLELNVEELVWAMDGDAWEKQKRAIEHCAPFFRQFVMQIEPDQDPNSLGPGLCEERLSTAQELKGEWDLIELAAAWGHM